MQNDGRTDPHGSGEGDREPTMFGALTLMFAIEVAVSAAVTLVWRWSA